MKIGSLSLFSLPDKVTIKKASTFSVNALVCVKSLAGARGGTAKPLRYPPTKAKYVFILNCMVT